MAGQHYCLRWNNYQSNMTSVFHYLLKTQAFVDVTLACNDQSLKAHKVGSKIIYTHMHIYIYYNRENRVLETISLSIYYLLLSPLVLEFSFIFFKVS